MAALLATLAPLATPAVAEAAALPTIPCTTHGHPGPVVTAPGPSLRSVATPRGVRIGSAINPALLDQPVYRDTVAREFSVVTPENQMKWSIIHPERDRYDFCAADQLAAFAGANGMIVRGHALVWHLQNPAWLTPGTFTRAELIDILRDHITTVVGHYRDAYPGVVRQWDVANEVVDGCGAPVTTCGLRPTLWSQGIGPDYLDYAFQFAHDADPAAELYINDYGIDGPGPKLNGVLAVAQGLRSRGVPIDGVGSQMHTWMWSGENEAAAFSQIAAAGFDVAITEIDVSMDTTNANQTPSDLSLGRQALVYRRALEACLAEPRCKTVVTWGFNDGNSWRSPNQPCLFDNKFRPKVAYDGWRAALLEPTSTRVGETVSREAENAAHDGTGSAVNNGWLLRTSGSAVRTTLPFGGSTASQVAVTARGALVLGAWPELEVRVGGLPVGTITVDSTTWRTYTVPAPVAAGPANVSVVFTNDAYVAPLDRNVEIDKVGVVSHRLEAESFLTRDSGASIADGWALYENGAISNSIAVNGGTTYDVRVRARGRHGAGAWPQVEVKVDGIAVGRATVASASWTDVVITAPIAAGHHTLSLGFVNDASQPPEDRNLYLDSVVVQAAPALF